MHSAMFCCSDTTGMQIESGDGSVAVAHKALGSIAFALLLLQVGGLLVIRAQLHCLHLMQCATRIAMPVAFTPHASD